MRNIILYGNSLAVSSVGACLREREGLRVLPVGTGSLKEALSPNEPRPDVLVFDLSTTQPGFAVELLRSKPGILLIGVDLSNGKALVLSSKTSRVLTTDDLVHVIESHADMPEQASAEEALLTSVGEIADGADKGPLRVKETSAKSND